MDARHAMQPIGIAVSPNTNDHFFPAKFEGREEARQMSAETSFEGQGIMVNLAAFVK